MPINTLTQALHALAHHGTPEDRGRADSYYRRSRRPHKHIYDSEFSYPPVEVTDLTPDEVAEYNRGYDENEAINHHKEW